MPIPTEQLYQPGRKGLLDFVSSNILQTSVHVQCNIFQCGSVTVAMLTSLVCLFLQGVILSFDVCEIETPFMLYLYSMGWDGIHCGDWRCHRSYSINLWATFTFQSKQRK